MLSKIHFLLIFSLFSIAGWAQSVSGTITNETGEPLAFASVSVAGKNISTVSSSEGFYRLKLDAGKYILQFAYLGFETAEHIIEIHDKPVTVDVVMRHKDIQLEEVNISAKDKDPAYEIMAQVVEHKHRYIHSPSSFKANTYIRASLEQELREGKKMKNDSIDPDRMVHFVESYGTTWYEHPGNIKEIKEAYKDRGEGNTESHSVGHYWDTRRRSGEAAAKDPYIFYVSVSEADFNLYESYVSVPKLGPVPFVSPVTATATLSYKFKLLRTYFEGEQMIYHIGITPRNKEGALYSGTIDIIYGDWAIKKYDLSINDGALYFFRDFHVQREYRKQDSLYLLTREEFRYATNNGKFLMKGNTFVEYSNYEIHPVIPKNFFKNELKVTLDGAYDKDSTYWEALRQEPLPAKEAAFSHKMDSLVNYHRSEIYLKKQDSIYNRIKPLDFLLSGVGFHNSFKKRTLFFNPLINSIRPFGVDGIRGALGGYYTKEFSRAHEVSFNGRLDYGYSNNDLKGYGRLRYLYNPRQLARAYISYGNIYSRITGNESIEGALSRGNYVNKIFYGFGHEIEVVNGLMLKAGMQYAQRKSIENLELNGWWDDLFGNEVEPKAFEPYNEWLLDLEVEYTPGQQYYTEPYRKVIIGSKWPTFSITYKKALPVLGATIDYDFIELEAWQDIRLKAFGTSRWQINTGVFLTSGKIQLTDERYFRGSDRYFFANPLEHFQLLGPTLSTTSEFIQVNYLHNFENTLLNKLPLIKLLGLHTVAGAGALLIPDQSFRHGEVWAGIEKPFRIRKQMIKIGIYGVTSDNNIDVLDGSFKVGIDFFNAFKGEWSY